MQGSCMPLQYSNTGQREKMLNFNSEFKSEAENLVKVQVEILEQEMINRWKMSSTGQDIKQTYPLVPYSMEFIADLKEAVKMQLEYKMGEVKMSDNLYFDKE